MASGGMDTLPHDGAAALMVGFSIQDYAASVATIIFLVVKQIGGIVTLTTLVFMLML